MRVSIPCQNSITLHPTTMQIYLHSRININIHGEKIKCPTKTNHEWDCLYAVVCLPQSMATDPAVLTLRKLLNLPVPQSLHKIRLNIDTHFMKLL